LTRASSVTEAARRRSISSFAGFLQRGRETAHLRAQDGLIDAGQDLAALNLVPRLHQHGGDAAAFAFGGNRDVVARRDRPGEGDLGGDGADAGRHHADEGRILGRGGLGRETEQAHAVRPHVGAERQQ
jgi:hypothetical protein